MARVAIVTGGTRGIGAAISVTLKNKGYSVAAIYGGDDATAAAFKEETGIPVYKTDVSDFAACEAGGDRGRSWSRRCAGEQRRNHARRHLAPYDPGNLAKGDRHQSGVMFQHVALRHRGHARA